MQSWPRGVHFSATVFPGPLTQRIHSSLRVSRRSPRRDASFGRGTPVCSSVSPFGAGGGAAGALFGGFCSWSLSGIAGECAEVSRLPGGDLGRPICGWRVRTGGSTGPRRTVSSSGAFRGPGRFGAQLRPTSHKGSFGLGGTVFLAYMTWSFTPRIPSCPGGSPGKEGATLPEQSLSLAAPTQGLGRADLILGLQPTSGGRGGGSYSATPVHCRRGGVPLQCLFCSEPNRAFLLPGYGSNFGRNGLSRRGKERSSVEPVP